MTGSETCQTLGRQEQNSTHRNVAGSGSRDGDSIRELIKGIAAKHAYGSNTFSLSVMGWIVSDADGLASKPASGYADRGRLALEWRARGQFSLKTSFLENMPELRSMRPHRAGFHVFASENSGKPKPFPELVSRMFYNDRRRFRARKDLTQTRTLLFAKASKKSCLRYC